MGKRTLITPSLFPWLVSMVVMMARAEDPYLFFTWKVTYGTLAPLGTPQEVILINGQFPGPVINSTTNNNVVINVFNELDEPLLFHWSGIQQKKNSWQDGTPGTMCPIQPGTNYTYHYQVKDQIGSFFYTPSTGLQRASGGFGGLTVHTRISKVTIPYAFPEDEYTVIVGDWYKDGHKALRGHLDKGKTLGRPDGVLINGKQGNVNDPKEEPLFTMKPGKTYRYRICNVGMKNSINFRFQGHDMKLVEFEGTHNMQNMYSSLDLHLGQCCAVLVTADKEPNDYYMIASSRFTKYSLQATGLVRYEGGKGAPSNVLPKPPVDVAWSLNQFRSLRTNLTASAARPNVQGTYHYGQINITRTIRLVNTAGIIDGKLRYAFNGHSHTDSETPLKLLEYYGVPEKGFKYDTMQDNPPDNVDTLDKFVTGPNVINGTYKDFIEIIFENHEKSIQTFHLDGHSFFAVAIEAGQWTPEKRKNYNLLDALSIYSIQVYPKSWATIMLSIGNAGMWQIRNESPERAYLGQQFYLSILSPERSLRDEYNLPETQLLCGIVKDMPKPPPYTL